MHRKNENTYSGHIFQQVFFIISKYSICSVEISAIFKVYNLQWPRSTPYNFLKLCNRQITIQDNEILELNNHALGEVQFFYLAHGVHA